MEVAFGCAVRVPGIEERGEDCEGVRWNGEEEGGDRGVAEGGDQGWEDVGYGAGGDDAEGEGHLGERSMALRDDGV